ncbi:four-helix bundle copper-binding protein [Nodosilinea sp. PGN35]|uniref:four-helix bundle copper-binding protein n=1 Tax=unclassified Nodosilinea TaxID=2628167 RepID=UPI000D132D5C|nr:four-helix bundle copper-binding protein [Nodosilinea sp. TSF1-S3]MDF0368396.1 four-helix bundle copper-binding protein [Nodosilinea sp. TSF1-S3]PSN11625.1 four-helix bundle copper-binding protein [filamentous cyanobacterium CCT1]PSN77923.1 four-helix bundle copper-binding protein [filamentous cyanobacterium CCP4]
MLLNRENYQSSFDKAMACAVECEHCAEACMGNPSMMKCARMCLDTGDSCRTLATFMVRGSYFIAPMAKACAEICDTCASECEKHDAEHCKKCAQACREAAATYRQIAEAAMARA